MNGKTKNLISDEKLKKIALEKERERAQIEARKVREYNYSFTADQRAIRLKKMRAAKIAKEEAERRLRKQEEKRQQKIQHEIEKKQVEQEEKVKARLSAKRFYEEIADRIVYISSRLSSSRLSNDPNRYTLY